MKDDICFKQSKRLAHTRAFVVFDWMANLAIDSAGGGDKVFGRKPGVAEFTPTDLSEETRRATRGNLANIGDIQALLERILPGYKNIVGQEGRNIQSLLRGEIPQDVQDSIKRTAAFRSLQGGYGGSGMSRALTARDLGRTSLDLMDRGGNAAQRWMATTQNSVAPFIVTTPMQAAQTERNNLYKQVTEQFKFNVEAAPDPGAAGLFNTISTIGSTAASFGLSSMGGAGGGARPASAPAATTNSGSALATGAAAGAGYIPQTQYAYGPWDQGYRWGGG
jgi:hypothetical protein